MFPAPQEPKGLHRLLGLHAGWPVGKLFGAGGSVRGEKQGAANADLHSEKI